MMLEDLYAPIATDVSLSGLGEGGKYAKIGKVRSRFHGKWYDHVNWEYVANLETGSRLGLDFIRPYWTEPEQYCHLRIRLPTSGNIYKTSMEGSVLDGYLSAWRANGKKPEMTRNELNMKYGVSTSLYSVKIPWHTMVPHEVALVIDEILNLILAGGAFCTDRTHNLWPTTVYVCPREIPRHYHARVDFTRGALAPTRSRV